MYRLEGLSKPKLEQATQLLLSGVISFSPPYLDIFDDDMTYYDSESHNGLSQPYGYDHCSISSQDVRPQAP